MGGDGRIIVPVAPGSQVASICSHENANHFFNSRGSGVAWRDCSLGTLCIDGAQSTVPSSVCCYYTGSLPSQTWFMLQHGCTQSVGDSLTEGWWYMSLCLHRDHDMSQGVTTWGSDITGVTSHVSRRVTILRTDDSKPKHDPVTESSAADLGRGVNTESKPVLWDVRDQIECH